MVSDTSYFCLGVMVYVWKSIFMLLSSLSSLAKHIFYGFGHFSLALQRMDDWLMLLLS